MFLKMTNYPFEIAMGYYGPTLVVNMTYLSRRAGSRKLGPVYIQRRSPFTFQLLPPQHRSPLFSDL